MWKPPLALVLTSLCLLSCQAQPSFLAVNSNPLTSQNVSSPDSRFYGTARDEFIWAQMEARSWDFSAQLARVEGGLVDEQGRSFEWKYYFTAYNKKNALLVNSRREKKEVPKQFFGTIFESSWRVDSKAALEAAKKQGLKSFPVFSMQIRDSGMRWEISSGDGLFWVDARTGETTKQ